jgi:hypothetical protein
MAKKTKTRKTRFVPQMILSSTALVGVGVIPAVALTDCGGEVTHSSGSGDAGGQSVAAQFDAGQFSVSAVGVAAQFDGGGFTVAAQFDGGGFTVAAQFDGGQDDGSEGDGGDDSGTG